MFKDITCIEERSLSILRIQLSQATHRTSTTKAMFYWTRYRPPWTHGTCRSWTPTTHSDLLYMFPELGLTWAHSKAGGSRQVFIYGCINRKSSRFFIWSVFPLRTPRYGMALHNNPVFDEQTADWYFGVIRAVVQKKEAWLSSPIQTA